MFDQWKLNISEAPVLVYLKRVHTTLLKTSRAAGRKSEPLCNQCSDDCCTSG